MIISIDSDKDKYEQALDALMAIYGIDKNADEDGDSQGLSVGRQLSERDMARFVPGHLRVGFGLFSRDLAEYGLILRIERAKGGSLS